MKVYMVYFGVKRIFREFWFLMEDIENMFGYMFIWVIYLGGGKVKKERIVDYVILLIVFFGEFEVM